MEDSDMEDLGMERLCDPDLLFEAEHMWQMLPFNLGFDLDPAALAYPLFPLTPPLHPREVATFAHLPHHMLPPHPQDIANLMFLARHLHLPGDFQPPRTGTFPAAWRMQKSRSPKKVQDRYRRAIPPAHDPLDRCDDLGFLEGRSPTDMLDDRKLMQRVSQTLNQTLSHEEQDRKNQIGMAVLTWLLSRGAILKVCMASEQTSILVQKCCELSHPHGRFLLREELRGNVLELMACKNGNHVVTKLIDLDCKELVEGQHPWPADFFFQEIKGHAVDLALTSLGSRLIERIVSYCTACPAATPVFEELSRQIRDLCRSNYGNYIVQKMIQTQTNFTSHVVQQVMDDKVALVRMRGGSHALQVALQHAPAEVAVAIFDLFKENSVFSDTKINSVTSDKFGRFVVAQILKVTGTCSGLPEAPFSDLVATAQGDFLRVRGQEKPEA